MSAAGKLKHWIHGRKDASVSLILEKLLETQLARYGRLLELKIDSRQNSASVIVHLKGELEAVQVAVEEYELGQDDKGTFVTVKRARTSREWLTLVLEDFLLNKRFPLPEEYAAYARMVL